MPLTVKSGEPRHGDSCCYRMWEWDKNSKSTCMCRTLLCTGLVALHGRLKMRSLLPHLLYFEEGSIGYGLVIHLF